MRRISEAIAGMNPTMTKSQRLLSAYVVDHCDRAAFMNSFELASATGLSQSTIIRFASALGYGGYVQLQDALREELKYRLDVLDRFDVIRDIASDEDLMAGIAMTDALNIKKTMNANSPDALTALATRLLMLVRVYVYGQGFAAPAALYLAAYLGLLLPGVTCVNLSGMDALSTLSGLTDGDALIVISFPLHTPATLELLSFANCREALVVTISEGEDSKVGLCADISLTSEWGDMGVNGSLAPVISLCSALVCLLARRDSQADRKLRAIHEAGAFQREARP